MSDKLPVSRGEQSREFSEQIEALRQLYAKGAIVAAQTFYEMGRIAAGIVGYARDKDGDLVTDSNKSTKKYGTHRIEEIAKLIDCDDSYVRHLIEVFKRFHPKELDRLFAERTADGKPLATVKGLIGLLPMEEDVSKKAIEMAVKKKEPILNRDSPVIAKARKAAGLPAKRKKKAVPGVKDANPFIESLARLSESTDKMDVVIKAAKGIPENAENKDLFKEAVTTMKSLATAMESTSKKLQTKADVIRKWLDGLK